MDYDYLDHLGGTSRTSNGVSDTESSPDKVPLRIEGAELARLARENSHTTFLWLMSVTPPACPTGQELLAVWLEIGRRVNSGFAKPEVPLMRKHFTPFDQTPPAQIEAELRSFVESLADRWDAGLQSDPVELAAIVEKRLDAEIHPFSDGCGRATKLFSAWILFLAGLPLPRYPDKEVYYREIAGGEEEWVRYYRTLLPRQ